MLVRGDSLAKSMSQYLVDRIEAHERIDVRTRTVVEACHGETHLEAITLRDADSGAETREPASLLFVFIGAAPHTDWLPPAVAAGDVRHESVKRVASAVGEGSVAVAFVHRHLASV